MLAYQLQVLLMEWMHTKVEPEWIAARGRKRMQFFLVNSVPLVHQQANILAVKFVFTFPFFFVLFHSY